MKDESKPAKGESKPAKGESKPAKGESKPAKATQPCVYMLRCRDGSLYTGWTNDIHQRIATHQSGKGGKYTRSRLPVEPVYLEFLPDKSTALKREAAIKKMRPAAKQALLTSPLNEIHRL